MSIVCIKLKFIAFPPFPVSIKEFTTQAASVDVRRNKKVAS